LSFRQTIVVPSEESAFPVLLIAWLKFFAMKPVSLIPARKTRKGDTKTCRPVQVNQADA
jgi:hypothetical protein